MKHITKCKNNQALKYQSEPLDLSSPFKSVTTDSFTPSKRETNDRQAKEGKGSKSNAWQGNFQGRR